MQKKYLKIALAFTLVNLALFQSRAQNLSNWQLMNGECSAICNVPQKPSTIYIGDKYGVIRKSTDKGFTWKLSARTISQVTNIKFISENVGFATNFSSDIIYATEDAGMTWKEKNIIDPNEPNTFMRFGTFNKMIPINETTMFFKIPNSRAKAGFYEVLTTRDAGKTFNIEFAPLNMFHISGDTLIAFEFALDPFGRSNSRISKSIDAGKSWEKSSTAPKGINSTLDISGVKYVYFVNSNFFYFTSGNDSDKNLYQSKDGGVTITAAPKPNDNSKVNWIHYKDIKNGLIHTSADVTPLYQTSDGGNTWTAINSLKTSAPIMDMKNNELISLEFSRTLYSNDYGLTWKHQSDYPYTIQVNKPPTSSTYNYFVQAVDSKTYFCSTGEYLLRSDDEGLTWKYVTNANNEKYPGLSYHCVSSDSIIQIKSSNNGLLGAYFSTDGGKTMKPSNTLNIFFNGSLDAIPRFSFLKGNKKNAIAYATLGNPNFWYTKDGGATWVKTASPTNSNINVFNFQMVALDAWFFIGVSNGKAVVYKSSDQGATWKDITGSTINISKSSQMASALGVYFVNKSLGYVFSDNGVFYKTTDGGESWVSIKSSLPTTHSSANFELMIFRTEKEGHLTSFGKFTLVSKDNISWEIGTFPSGRAIDFVNETNGAMILQYGYFLKYFDNQALVKENVVANVTSVENSNSMNKNFVVFPNPFTDELEIFTKEESLQLSVYDLLGNEILRNLEINNGKTNALNTLPNGVYILKNKQHQAIKIIKN
ncbi:MAG: T9SS C-terminal target domain-containing protein [Cytophagales bacterium]|nr:MAG: T9SS C-terminal target domain-containing protein [Cytophagales bacterium]